MSQMVQPDLLCRIDIYSHFFTITKARGRMPGIINRFAHRYIKFEWNKGRRTAGKTFGFIHNPLGESRFHIGQLGEFVRMLQNEWVDPELYEWYVHPMYEPVKVNISSKERFVLRPDQEDIRNFILEPDEHGDLRTRFIAAYTGSGKTVSALCTVADPRRRTRTFITAFPKYAEKWPGDVLTITNAEDKDILTVNGSKEIKAIIQHAEENILTAKFIIASLSTILIWLRLYQKDPILTEEMYGCKPQDFWRLLGIGQIILDEAHEDTFGVFSLMAHCHVPQIIGLSGTLLSRDAFVEKIQKIMFPQAIRVEGKKIHKYIKAYAISYTFDGYEKLGIRITERGSTTYSQVAYEESIMRRPNLLKLYLDMIGWMVDEYYMKDYQEGDRLVIFSGRQSMSTLITKYLKKRYVDLDVRRFIQGDPYENMLEADVRCTTILSGGTAHDISNLRCAIMLNNIQSPAAVLQAIGRLRDLITRDVKFVYAFSDSIEKHINYHRERMELIADRTLFVKELHYDVLFK